jgi:hypothetical protein
LAAAAQGAERPYFSVLSGDAGPWPEILSSIGLQRQPAATARILVARAGAPVSTEWMGRVENGAILILEGESSLAEAFGFRRSPENVRVTSLTDVHQPKLSIVWAKGLELPVFTLPAGAVVFARERWTGAPMLAGVRRGAGAALWLAAPPGDRGYERFPYLLQALCDLGMAPPFRSARLWAFFDSAYRLRVDPDYFAVRWRKSGIAALHVAGWQYFEPDRERDEYLTKLIQACHREGILVYAWLELPHVSDRFWQEHPEWREKTGLLQDAQLDWRKLMNLANRDCFRAVSAGVGELAARFDWDGVNLAELYFESLEGIANPSRFTPFNADVRAEFRGRYGFDPVDIFGPRKDDASRRLFLDFRSDLARRMQEEWLDRLEALRREKPDLDIVLTHIDDRLDAGMKDALGADAARVLPLMERHPLTFLIEDPATVWNLGAERYQTIAERYRQMTPHPERLAIDINIVERYQNVYPTRQQTGVELFELVHRAAANFQRVALYFESSLAPADLQLLPSAAAAVTRVENVGRKLFVESASGVGAPWKGPAMVDGHTWPVTDGDTVWLPGGAHDVSPAAGWSGPAVIHLNADLRAARAVGANGVEFSYRSGARAIAILSRIPRSIELDGVARALALAGPRTLLLPRGEHTVLVETRGH